LPSCVARRVISSGAVDDGDGGCENYGDIMAHGDHFSEYTCMYTLSKSK
jgi:hypothetical protein